MVKTYPLVFLLDVEEAIHLGTERKKLTKSGSFSTEMNTLRDELAIKGYEIRESHVYHYDLPEAFVISRETETDFTDGVNSVLESKLPYHIIHLHKKQ